MHVNYLIKSRATNINLTVSGIQPSSMKKRKTANIQKTETARNFNVSVIDLNCMLKVKCYRKTSIMIIIGEHGSK